MSPLFFKNNFVMTDVNYIKINTLSSRWLHLEQNHRLHVHLCPSSTNAQYQLKTPFLIYCHPEHQIMFSWPSQIWEEDPPELWIGDPPFFLDRSLSRMMLNIQGRVGQVNIKSSPRLRPLKPVDLLILPHNCFRLILLIQTKWLLSPQLYTAKHFIFVEYFT